MIEKYHCPACHQTQKRLRGEKDKYDIYICQKCGALYAIGKEKVATGD